MAHSRRIPRVNMAPQLPVALGKADFCKAVLSILQPSTSISYFSAWLLGIFLSMLSVVCALRCSRASSTLRAGMTLDGFVNTILAPKRLLR